MVVLGKEQAMEVSRLVNDEENDCSFKVQREEYWIHTQPTWLIADRERLLELFCWNYFCDQTSLML